jgi:DNA-directed RNA polymerase subunit RPC12/RpoP
MKTNEELTLELKCARCGRKLGVYTGKTFYILGLDAEAKIVCEECYIEGFGARGAAR